MYVVSFNIYNDDDDYYFVSFCTCDGKQSARDGSGPHCCTNHITTSQRSKRNRKKKKRRMYEVINKLKRGNGKSMLPAAVGAKA